MSPASPVSWIARWRQRLIRLPETIFFDLVRCYIGEIKSPFNKQELLQRLENFITRADVKNRILSMLSFEDRKLLSTIRMIPGLSEERLHDLAAPDRSYLDFHIRVLNLEDRLLMWREDEHSGIRLNPHLEQDLLPYLSDSLVLDEEPRIADPVDVSGKEPAGVPDKGPAAYADTVVKPAQDKSADSFARAGFAENFQSRAWLDDGFLAAVFSFVQECPELFTAQDQIRKRALQDFGLRFAGLRDIMGLRQEPDYAEILTLVTRGLLLLGLVHNEGEGTQLDYERWLELASLPQERRLALVISAILYPKSPELFDSEGRVAFFSQTRIADFGRAVFAWARRIDAGKNYGEVALKTLWTVEIEQTGRNAVLDEAIGPAFLTNAARLGLFSRSGKSWSRNDWGVILDRGETRPALKAEASLDLILTGQAQLMDLLVLAACASLQSYGFVSAYKLNQTSARSGFAKSIDDKSLISLIERLSGAGIPQSVSFSISDWYKDFTSVRIIDGVVVIAEGRRRVEIEHSEQIRPFVLSRPAEGIFVLDRGSASDWLPMLENIGVRTGLRPADFSTAPVSARFLPPLMSLDLSKLGFPPAAQNGFTRSGNPLQHKNQDDADDEVFEPTGNFGQNGLVPKQVIMDELKAVLDAATFSDDHRQAFTERLRAGLILTAEQIVPGALRLEHSEARGLDYTGKIRIIEQAIKTRSDFLEIQTRGDEGQMDGSWRMLIWPQKLRQMGSDLVLIAQTVPEGRELSIMISRILSVKRVRGSIFG